MSFAGRDLVLEHYVEIWPPKVDAGTGVGAGGLGLPAFSDQPPNFV